MEFSIATLLSHLNSDKLVAGKILERKLGCETENAIQTLQIALDILERIGILEKDRGKYRRVQDESLVEAKLRCSSKGFCFAIQNDEDAEDIYVRESRLSNAWNGDRVLVRVVKEGSRRRSPEGSVELILERANPSVLAQVKQREEKPDYYAIPLDDRLLFELHLQDGAEKLNKALDHLVHVSVLRYPLGNNPPIGKVSRILGSDAEAAADTDIVCCKHDLPQVFAPEVLASIESLPSGINQDQLKQRHDFRDLVTFALTDDSLPFVQNAFTLEKSESGNWQVGIHIVDVAEFVVPDSLLDRAAEQRGTAIYLGDKILPLFPDMLASHFAFVSGEDRLAVSVLLELDSAGKMVEFSVRPSIICLDTQLSYEEAQKFLSDDKETSPPEDA